MIRKTVIIADDEDTLRRNLAQVLEEEGFEVIPCRDGAEALRKLKNNGVDALITDLRMPGVPGMELIDHARKLAPDASIIVITAFGEVETAVAAMKKGARDYICKPINFDELVFRLKRLMAHEDLARENKVLRDQVRRSHHHVEIVGKSPKFAEIIDNIAPVAQARSNVLICGESGTGKEVLARAIHDQGPHADKPFVAVNCGGLADTLLESELFGYRSGAFTGASADRTGYFEAANGGTLFLDEIGNLPARAQPTLLRAIEERAVTRVGDNRPRPVDIRIIAATNRDLEEAIDAGEFRQDLYYRINVIRLELPPLRERPEDIPLLVEHFVQKYNAELKSHCPGFTPAAIEAMRRRPWRGNVRELENTVERALIFARNNAVDVGDLVGTDVVDTATRPTVSNLRAATREFEKRHIMHVLEQSGHNKASTAETLGIGLSSLYRKLEELGISKHHVTETRTA